MAINFPINPTPGQIYAFEERTWEYTGKGWRLLSQISLANSAFNRANASFITANAAFDAANGAIAVNLTQNTNITYAWNTANAAFLAANNATDTYVRNHANAAFDQANAAYGQANTNASNITIIQGVNLTQNTSISNIEGVNLTQNTNITNAQNSADSAFHQANASYAQANTNATNIGVIQGVNLTQNTSISNIEGVNLTQNTSISNIEGVNLTQNTNITNAQNKADSAFHQANGAFATANNEAGVNATQNTNITNAQNTADAAFIRANNSLSANAGGTVTGNVTILGNVAISGNLIISGNTFSLSVGTLVANDSLIILGSGNYDSDTVDIGFAGHYNDGTNAHSGLIRDVGTKEWYLFKNYTPEIGANNNVIITDPTFTVDTLNANLKSTFITVKGIEVLPYINAAFNKANNEAGVNDTQNTNITAAQTKADNSFHQANAAYATANNEAGVNLTQNNSITAAFTAANSAGVYANAAFNAANNATDTYVRAHANAAFDQANAAYNQANTAGIVIAVDAFTGTGSCTTFALSTTPSNENYTVVTVSGITQAKTTYSLSGGNLVFSEAPPNESNVEVIIFTSSSGSFLAYNDGFTGTGACTTFTLTTTPTNENYTIISVAGVIQHKVTYSLSGNSLIFSEAPPNGSSIDATYFVASSLLDSSLTIYAANHANAAFIAANNATDTYVRNHANSAFHQANAAYAQANTNATNITIIQGVNTSQNNEITYAENHANSAFHQANAAFSTANNASASIINGLFFTG